MGLRSFLRRLLRRRRRAANGGTTPDQVILPDPIPGQFQLTASEYSVMETTGYVFVYVERTAGDDGAVSVQYSTSDGTAVAGLDFTTTQGTLNWGNQDNNARSFSIPILARDVTGDFTFSVSISNPLGGATIVEDFDIATITIHRRSRGEAGFTPGQWYKLEPGSPSDVSVTVQRNIAFKGSVGVSWHTVDNTAIAGTDYTADSGTLSWSDGDGSAKTISVEVLDRSGTQGDRNFDIVIDTPTGGLIIDEDFDTANVIITESAPPANPTPTASIQAQLIFDGYYDSSDELLDMDQMIFNYNIQVGSGGHGRALSFGFNGIYAFDANTVWAVGNVGYITKTINGGTNWVQKTSGTDAYLYAVHFADVNNGWIVGAGGIILRTTDGGDTWAGQTSGTPKDLLSVYFISTTVGWAVGVDGVIIKTTDGGTTWTGQTSTTFRTLTGISALDTNTAWVVGFNGIILKTTNGTTWAAQTSGVTHNLNGVSAIDATHVWAVGNNGTILFHNGTTWAAQTSGVTHNLNAISFENTTVGWAVGSGGCIRATTDGSTWGSQTSAVDENLTSIWTASTTVAYLTGESTIQKTVNGGANWTSSLDVDAVIGFGGFGNGGATNLGGVDFTNRDESFSSTGRFKFQGYPG